MLHHVFLGQIRNCTNMPGPRGLDGNNKVPHDTYSWCTYVQREQVIKPVLSLVLRDLWEAKGLTYKHTEAFSLFHLKTLLFAAALPEISWLFKNEMKKTIFFGQGLCVFWRATTSCWSPSKERWPTLAATLSTKLKTPQWSTSPTTRPGWRTLMKPGRCHDFTRSNLTALLSLLLGMVVKS